MVRLDLISLVICLLSLVQAVGAQAASPGVVTFHRAAPAEGDEAAQKVSMQMEMEISLHQGQQVRHTEQTRVHRLQERLVRLNHVESGRRLAGEVTYKKAQEMLAQGSAPAQAVGQPVEGKTYLVERREGDLTITDGQGQMPPQDEFEIVWHNMESFGKPNPLATFLAGRTITIGQKLELPQEVATRILAFGDDVIEVERFELTLQDVNSTDGHPLAQFHAEVTSRSHGRGQMGMQVEGSLVVDAATCRVKALELAGPLGLTQTHTNGPETFLVSGRGKIRVAMDAVHTNRQ